MAIRQIGRSGERGLVMAIITLISCPYTLLCGVVFLIDQLPGHGS
jgi:hypothetical protein